MAMYLQGYDPNSLAGQRAIRLGYATADGRAIPNATQSAQGYVSVPEGQTYSRAGLTPVTATKAAPSYASIPDYMGIAKQYLPEPKPLSDISTMPEYGKAMSWDLPSAPALAKARTIDPQAYENQWKLSSDAIRKSFYGQGGANEQAVNSVLERGLGTSGERGDTVARVADSFANALANARLGIDTARMQEAASVDAQNAQSENALNQMMFGAGMSRNQGIANAAMQLLAARQGAEQFNSGLPLAYGQALLGAATGMADNQNQIVANQWAQRFQEAQSQAQQQMQTFQMQEQQRMDSFNQVLTMVGQLDLPREEEQQLVDWWMGQSGNPLTSFNSYTGSSGSSAPVTNYSSPTGLPMSNTLPSSGSHYGQIQRVDGTNYMWTGRDWVQV